MGVDTDNEKPIVHPDMTILGVVSRFRQSEAVFRQYDEKAGVCLCCQAFFDPLKNVAQSYGLDLAELISKLKRAARNDSKPLNKPENFYGP